MFFVRDTPQDTMRIALTIDGDQVAGTQVWEPKQEAHGARGTLRGVVTGGGLLKVLYEYTIEGSEQTEEELLKLEGDKLFIGEGELVEQKNGKLKLKAPDKVVFEKPLSRISVSEPAAGTPERKAVMDAMRGLVAAHVGKAVTFTGNVRVSGSWARFSGNVAPADGKAPKEQDAAFQLELDFFALLKKDPDGIWQVLHWGFAGDPGVLEAAREKYPKAPWVLFEG